MTRRIGSVKELKTLVGKGNKEKRTIVVPGGTCGNAQGAGKIHQKVMEALSDLNIDDVDVFIGCAAVADYGIAEPASQKLKKNDDQLVLTMVKNPDIISAVAQHDKRPFCVGFAAETENAEQYGRQKLQRKQLDMICINDVSNQEIGFNSDMNELIVVIANNEACHKINKSTKQNVASELLLLVEQQLKDRST